MSAFQNSLLHAAPSDATERRLTLVLTSWALLVFGLGASGLLSRVPLPAFGLTVFGLLAAGALTYYRSPTFFAYVQTIPLKHLTIFHVWRIGAGWLFLHSYAQGQLPATFTQNAAYGDILAGLLVPLVLLSGETRRAYWFFNVVGLADFLLAVGTGLTLTLLGTESMKAIETLPLALIPLFGVPISGLSHLMALDRLIRTRNSA